MYSNTASRASARGRREPMHALDLERAESSRRRRCPSNWPCGSWSSGSRERRGGVGSRRWRTGCRGPCGVPRDEGRRGARVRPGAPRGQVHGRSSSVLPRALPPPIPEASLERPHILTAKPTGPAGPAPEIAAPNAIASPQLPTRERLARLYPELTDKQLDQATQSVHDYAALLLRTLRHRD